MYAIRSYYAVCCGSQNAVLGGKCLGTAQNDTVYNDQRNKDTELEKERVGKCLHDQFHHRNEGGDDDSYNFV